MSSTLPRYHKIGFVGARRLEAAGIRRDAAESEGLLRVRIEEILTRLQSELGKAEPLTAVSALAAGADTIFAEVIASMGIPHEVFLPHLPELFFVETDFFNSPQCLERSRKLLGSPNVIDVAVVSSALDRRERFSECGYEVAFHSDVLIAVLKPEDLGKPGGTHETLSLAKKLGIRIIEIFLDAEFSVHETAANPITRVPRADDEVFRWSLGDGHDDQAPMRSVVSLKQAASARSGKVQRLFRYAAAITVLSHIAATAVAAWALAGLWGDGHLGPVKLVCLLAGLGVFVFLHFWHPQRVWVTVRLVAELTRSVIAVRGLKGRLDYLESFHLPGSKRLIRTLGILHLTQEHRSPNSDPEAFKEDYLEKRLDGQIAYFKKEVRKAKKYRSVLGSVFFASSALALISVLIYLFGHEAFHIPETMEKMSQWQRLIFKFAPIALPMVAAGAASWSSLLDLDRRADRYQGMVEFLEKQRLVLSDVAGLSPIRKVVHRVEQALLQEVVEWHAKHAHVQGH